MQAINEKKTIMRVIKNKENPYFLVNRTSLNDCRLSAKAKGIHIYLLSLPDDWKIYIEELTNHFTDGRDSISSGIQELIKYQYIQRNRLQNEKGQFCGYEYLVFEVPQNTDSNEETEPVSPVNGKSVNGEPVNGKSVNGKPGTTKYLSKQNNNSTEKEDQSVSQSLEISTEGEETDWQTENPPAKPSLREPVSVHTIQEQIGYTALIQQHSPALVDEIVLNMLDMHYSSRVKVKGEMKPQALVQSALAKITHWHIQYVLERFKEVTTTIQNKKDYLQSMIYNSVLEKDAHYQNALRT